MVDEYLVRSLKRVHDQAASDLQVTEPTSSKTTAERFNQVLTDFQEAHPDNDRLDRIDEVEGKTASLRNHERANEDLRKIKLKTEQIADLFELDMEDFERLGEAGEMQPIVIQQHATQETEVTAEQSAEMNITVEHIEETIEHIQRPPEQKEELEKLLREFNEELEGEQDDTRLQQLLGAAAGISENVSTQMAQRALMYGVTSVLSLAG
ncbi:hypothetical protein [Saliphagus sp. LR7]|uniref:hypothetical protein n=1 Tax=Saliphagus sp. LR7 TaxID=2282654 RepID=UPI001300285C|nr:hypothetical protein [Saliphagus sp. LR7]